MPLNYYLFGLDTNLKTDQRMAQGHISREKFTKNMTEFILNVLKTKGLLNNLKF